MIRLWFVLFAGLLLQAAELTPDRARDVFSEASAAATHAAGLWGRDLNGPILLVDLTTRSVIANQADAENKLARKGAVWTGTLPPEINAANTAMTWAGVHWTVLIWPLPDRHQERVKLLTHELFHRVQDDLGLMLAGSPAPHLDQMQARIYLQLEWSALEEALRTTRDPQKRAIHDALLFRAWRRSLFPGAAAAEQQLELTEGLAEYTGVKNSTRDLGEFKSAAISLLRSAPDRASFTRTFAYASGPAYGALLDEFSNQWRKTLNQQSDLGDVLKAAAAVSDIQVSAAAAAEAARRYDSEWLIRDEQRRDADRKEQVSAIHRKFIDAPVLYLAVDGEMNYSFNPGGILAVDDQRLYYPSLRFTSGWGTVEADGGAVLVRKGDQVVGVQVPLSRPDALEGEGWKLMLKPEWQVVPGPRPQDRALARKVPAAK